jgi:quercetin dioxygenase-like cupin family protein
MKPTPMFPATSPMKHRRLQAKLVVVLALLVPVLGQAEGLPIVQVRADELAWVQTPTGIHTATVIGNPGKAGLYVMRGKLPPGFKIPPHTHPDERVVTVLSGTLYLGFGDQFDEASLKALPPGSLWTEPGGRAHFVWAKDGEVIFQVNGMGPTATVPVQAKQ